MDVYRIARYIGHATVDIGSLCASVKVNIWSKKRPIAANTDEDLTDLVRQSLNWGYVITEYTDLRAMLTAARAIGVGKPCWTSTKPSAQSPHYRMHDFIGYDHFAEAPFPWEFAGSGKTIYRGGKLRFYPGEEVEGALEQSDFPQQDSIYGCKIGVVVRKVENDTTTQPVLRCTFTGNSTDFGNDPSVYDILASRLVPSGNGTYEACLFFSTVDITLDGDLSAGKFYMLPYSYFTFMFNTATGISIYGDGVVRNYGGNNSFSFAFHVQQNGEVQTVSTIRVWCLAKSAQNTDWSKGSNGAYIISGETAPGPGGTPATVQCVSVGNVSTANYTQMIQFAIDGDDYPSDYDIVCEYAVGGQVYWVEQFIDDDIEEPEES